MTNIMWPARNSEPHSTTMFSRQPHISAPQERQIWCARSAFVPHWDPIRKTASASESVCGFLRIDRVPPRRRAQRSERFETKAALSIVGNTDLQVGSEHRQSFLADPARRQHR